MIEPSHRGKSYTLYLGDCVAAMAKMPENSVDAIVTDPPYGLEFMGKEWDKLQNRRDNQSEKHNQQADTTGRGSWAFGGTPSSEARIVYKAGRTAQAWHEAWAREALRVLKPGGYMLAAGGTRTFHRLVCALEDAGFEVRDTIMHVYGSGFPKSLNVGKAIDKMAGAEREVVGEGAAFGRGSMRNRTRVEQGYRPTELNPDGGSATITAPATEEAKAWDGWGTALKPSQEPWTLCRKPLSESSVARNVLQWGTGAINVDGTRVGTGETLPERKAGYNDSPVYGTGAEGLTYKLASAGRWPPNLLLSHAPGCNGECVPGCPVREMDGQSGVSKSTDRTRHNTAEAHNRTNSMGKSSGDWTTSGHSDQGGSSRFFPRFDTEPPFLYQAKASRTQRNQGLGSTLTVKYNSPKLKKGELCAEMVALLGRATSDTPGAKWLIGESGASITGLCQPDSLSTISTAIRRTMTSLTSPLSMLSPTSEYTPGASCEMGNGGNPAASAESSNGSKPTTTSDGTELTPSARLALFVALWRISDAESWTPLTNIHSTVKPLALMDWLITLICPPGGTVLDPFMGSGSTGCSAARLGFDFIGIEREPEYLEIARRRIEHWSKPEAEKTNGKAPAKVWYKTDAESEPEPVETLF